MSHRRSTGDLPFVIIGMGDHSRVVVEAARAAGETPAGFVNPDPITTDGPADPQVLGDLVGDLQWLERLGSARFIVAIGRNDIRADVFQRARGLGLEPSTVVHPTATLLTGSEIGPGSQVCAHAVIGVDARVGENVIINTAATVDHDDRIGDHASVGPGAHLAGRVWVGTGTHIGLGSSVREGVRIGAWSVVASGAAVIHDVSDGTRVAGVPARPMEQPADPGRRELTE